MLSAMLNARHYDTGREDHKGMEARKKEAAWT